MDCGHWALNEGVVLNENVFGFIYLITNKLNNKKYIGKKQCFMRRKRKPLKGYKRNRITVIDSDWKNYTSSSKELNDDILKYGKENFEFKIIKTCDSKWSLAYFEIKEQIEQNVLLREDYYNGIINVRIGSPPTSEKQNYLNLQKKLL